MIFNHCIYGNINKTVGYLRIKYYSYNLDFTVQKDTFIENGTYQFNLGDSDLLGLNYSLNKGDICIIEYHNTTKEYSEIIQINDYITNHNIIVSTFSENTDSANFNVSESLVKTTNHKITEVSTNLYNYFEIKDLTLNEIKYSSNSSELYFVPVHSNLYRILQKSINNSTSIISTKEYVFNAIVSGASITRSNKCKSINDSIKLLFMSNDIAPSISIIKDEVIIENSTMTSEGNLLYSYNFVFPSEGHYCFRIDYNDETYLSTFRVLKSTFKVYYIEENYKNETLNYNMYFINDTSTILQSGTFNYIDNGLYSSQELNVEYGDYMFEVNDEFFVSSFEECSSSGSNSSINNIKQEIYWIFPNNEVN
jgi:hypothetical protein